MSHFLWVEDFGNFENKFVISSTVTNVFGKILSNSSGIPCEEKEALKTFLNKHGIFLELDFYSALAFIRDPDKMRKVDYIILDIDLPSCPTGTTEPLELKEFLSWYNDSTVEFIKVAGYHLYLELVMKLSFPPQHILIASDHANHLTSIQQAFKNAKMDGPKIYNKGTTEKKNLISGIVQYPVCKEVERYDASIYAALRRGVIEICEWVLDSLCDDDQLTINNFVLNDEHHFGQEDIRSYWEVLRDLLPLREPADEKKKNDLFCLFVRTLVRIWDDAVDYKYYSERPISQQTIKNRSILTGLAILKSCRNHSMHGDALEMMLPYAPEVLVAYLLLLNLHAMVSIEDGGNAAHEKALLRVFTLKSGFTSYFKSAKSDYLDEQLTKLIKQHNNWLANSTEKIEMYKNGKVGSFYFRLTECRKNPYFLQSHSKELLHGLFALYWVLPPETLRYGRSEDIFYTGFSTLLRDWCFPPQGNV